ncbi:unnamed protein product [Euphydryas editha]|uniref:DUF7041 domain-containing protein n=1 Tax=Euphydryas editha TaxID=104508 RepID=A0AAU9UTQ4_EUPED|nr:unnamed protein product [Euphydryas editha]
MNPSDDAASTNGRERSRNVALPATLEDSVFKVGVRIPPFWPEEPALWFAQIEGQFIISGITADTTKFYYVIAQLDHQYAAEVKDVITSPPAENKYNKLKTELIKRLSESQERKVQQLLIHEELGDRKPSQFLRHLRTLAGQTVPDSFLRTLWSSRLPHNIQTVIASQAESTLESVADLADRIHEIASPIQQVARVSAGNSVDELKLQIEELTRQVASLQANQVRNAHYKYSRLPRSRERRSSAHRYRSRSRSRTPKSNYCWYHNRFGVRANKCIEPCSFKSGNDNGSH